MPTHSKYNTMHLFYNSLGVYQLNKMNLIGFIIKDIGLYGVYMMWYKINIILLEVQNNFMYL